MRGAELEESGEDSDDTNRHQHTVPHPQQGKQLHMSDMFQITWRMEEMLHLLVDDVVSKNTN